MTPAQKSRLIGLNASLSQRGVSVTVQPADVEVLALVEEITEKTRQRLQVLDDVSTQAVHVLRSALVDNTVTALDLTAIAELDRADSDQSYRVQHYRDDPQKPAVIFFCTLK